MDGKFFVWCIIILASLAAVMFLWNGQVKMAAFYALTALINWVMIW